VAIKQIEKRVIIDMDKQESVMREKTILQKMSGSRFVIEIRQTFMDDANLYFVFEHCQYGTLSNLINELGKVQSLTHSVL
jgi:serine/threonine protein kinase